MTDKTISPELKAFLEEGCKAGDYISMTLMVNKQHLQEFQAQVAAIKNGTGEAVVLGLNGKKKLTVVSQED